MFSFGRFFFGGGSLKVLMVRRLCSRRVVATHRRQAVSPVCQVVATHRRQAVSPVRQVVTSHRRQVVMLLAEELKGTNADAPKNEDLLQGRGVSPGLQHGGDDWLLRAVRGRGEQLPIGLGLLLQR